MRKILINALSMWLVVFLIIMPFVHADPGDVDLIVEPLNNIYDLIKGVISVVAIIAITFAGARFMFSGPKL